MQNIYSEGQNSMRIRLFAQFDTNLDVDAQNLYLVWLDQTYMMYMDKAPEQFGWICSLAEPDHIH